MSSSDDAATALDASGATGQPTVHETGEGPGRRHRLRRWVIGLLVLVAAGAGVFALLWTRTGAHPVTVGDARKRIGPIATSTTVPGEARPPPGVYLFRGAGTDRLESLSKEQAEGPDMPATVTYTSPECWQFRIDYSSNHWQSWDYCNRAGAMEETGGRTHQLWDFVVFTQDTTTTFACASSVTIRKDQRPGDEWQQSCRGTSDPTSLSAGLYRFVGPTTLDIGGQRVAAFHYHRDRVMSEGQTGTEHSDVWFAADTGMPLRNEREIDVATSTVIGDVTYKERGWFQLTSLQPRS